jgi:2-methylisocitrate lyase-like PEP mutase family enzyme
VKDRQKLFRRFLELHRPGDPLILFNAWDAGSARAVAQAGAPAIATGSWSVAAAHGYADGEKLPLDLVVANAERVAGAVDLPVSIDFEGAYGTAPDEVWRTAALLAQTGAIGCNVEDRQVRGDGLHPIRAQAERIAAIRDATAPFFFINARTDLFLKRPPQEHGEQLAEAVERCHAYAEAGAHGFFVPGLIDRRLIARLCERAVLPVNLMALPGAPDADELGELGVARISHGPAPYRLLLRLLQEAAGEHYQPKPARALRA